MAEKFAETRVVWSRGVIGGSDGWESNKEFRGWEFTADVTAGTEFVWVGRDWGYCGDEKDFAASTDEFGD
jgi:hypothetical protein